MFPFVVGNRVVSLTQYRRDADLVISLEGVAPGFSRKPGALDPAIEAKGR